jgi:hypothetical protein
VCFPSLCPEASAGTWLGPALAGRVIFRKKVLAVDRHNEEKQDKGKLRFEKVGPKVSDFFKSYDIEGQQRLFRHCSKKTFSQESDIFSTKTAGSGRWFAPDRHKKSRRHLRANGYNPKKPNEN